jgi:hypothetical protein
MSLSLLIFLSYIVFDALVARDETKLWTGTTFSPWNLRSYSVPGTLKCKKYPNIAVLTIWFYILGTLSYYTPGGVNGKRCFKKKHITLLTPAIAKSMPTPMQPYITQEHIDASTIRREKTLDLQTFGHKHYAISIIFLWKTRLRVRVWSRLVNSLFVFLWILSYSCDNNFSPTEQKMLVCRTATAFQAVFRGFAICY